MTKSAASLVFNLAIKRPVITFLSLFLLFHSSPVNSQTKWFKYDGNPVLDVGPLGAWDGALVTPSRVIVENSTYKMWYTGFYGSKYWQVGYATSPDGIMWKKHKSNPVLKTGPQSWDSSGAAHGYVLHTGSKYEMWYTGGDGGRNLHIGYATSPDGIVWTKANSLNPVLKMGPPGTWDSRGLSRSSVIGPDSGGSYKMWFAGEDSNFHKIGVATGTSPTLWTKRRDPVLTAGNSGSWDGRNVFFPRVLYQNGIYEMWYDGLRIGASRRIGYATSLDGIHWRKSSENPVLVPGSGGSWDGGPLLVGDVLFDGQMYHLWYSGVNEPSEQVGAWRTGYAVSPRGTSVTVSPTYVVASKPVHVSVRIASPAQLSFSAEIQSPDGEVVNRIGLFDDGQHDDGLAADGLFSNSWVPSAEKHYFVDLKLKFRKKEFRMKNAGAFTTVGPVTYEGLKLSENVTPHPGDTVLIKLVLRNRGVSGIAAAVEASLASLDSSVAGIAASPGLYGDIRPGESATTSAYYRVYIRPDCPVNTDVKFDLSISSSGIDLWRDTFTLHVLAPWWRTNWAYGLYLLLLVGTIGGTIWYAGNRKLKLRIKRLEQERALERERARISQDMHDEVGATLTEIAILSELAKKKPEEAGKQVQQISDRAAEVIDSIGEIVWALNPKNDSLDNLIAHIRRHAVEYLKLTPIQCRFAVPDSLPAYPLTAEVRRNLFLAAKEAIHNIVKHSQASEVVISVGLEKSRLELSIDDNGRGFSVDGRSGLGNGLDNMQKRMEEIGGSFQVDSIPNQGTKVRLVVEMNASR